MKKFLYLICFVFLLNGCDDGDLEVESFDFSTAQTDTCNENTENFFLFKINDKEALILKIAESNFPNTVTPEGSPRIIPISTTNKVIYRLYDGEVEGGGNGTVCSAIPSSTPNVDAEWNAI